MDLLLQSPFNWPAKATRQGKHMQVWGSAILDEMGLEGANRSYRDASRSRGCRNGVSKITSEIGRSRRCQKPGSISSTLLAGAGGLRIAESGRQRCT